jgi:hypothetical protein
MEGVTDIFYLDSADGSLTMVCVIFTHSGMVKAMGIYVGISSQEIWEGILGIFELKLLPE